MPWRSIIIPWSKAGPAADEEPGEADRRSHRNRAWLLLQQSASLSRPRQPNRHRTAPWDSFQNLGSYHTHAGDGDDSSFHREADSHERSLWQFNWANTLYDGSSRFRQRISCFCIWLLAVGLFMHATCYSKSAVMEDHLCIAPPKDCPFERLRHWADLILRFTESLWTFCCWRERCLSLKK